VGKTQGLLTLQQMVHIITTGRWTVKILSKNLPRKFLENLETLRLGAEVLTPDFRI
jgi:hypothetical protein